ncbi:MAG: ATP-binding cassette domain-containing protein [Pseudonocardiaceae bacterium]|nr:ATP-binding cassette domain-containing protein [Pseudonocardiaceae bacterium]
MAQRTARRVRAALHPHRDDHRTGGDRDPGGDRAGGRGTAAGGPGLRHPDGGARRDPAAGVRRAAGRGTAAAARSGDGRLRRGGQRGRRGDDGGGQHRGPDAGADHRCRAGHQPGGVRAGHRLRHGAAGPGVRGEPRSHAGSTTPIDTTTGRPVTPRIGCRDLAVRAGGRTILSVDALDVGAGETLAVLGANGAGKSTLVRALALLTSRERGTVLLDGRPAIRAAVRSAVAAVLQRPILRRGTVAANAASGLVMRGLRRAEALRRAEPWLHRLGAADLADRDARGLSGGETQRVALARALAVGPRVLILDEPFAALDATTRTDLIADLQVVLADLGTATILVTHDRDEAAALADRTALLVDGSLRQIGATSTVLDQPADADCARLVGFTNVLPPELTGLRGTVVARPEHCTPVPPGDSPPPDTFVTRGRVDRTVPLGGVTRIDVSTDAGSLACLVTGEAPDGITPGATVAVAVAAERSRTVHDAADLVAPARP